MKLLAQHACVQEALRLFSYTEHLLGRKREDSHQSDSCASLSTSTIERERDPGLEEITRVSLLEYLCFVVLSGEIAAFVPE